MADDHCAQKRRRTPTAKVSPLSRFSILSCTYGIGWCAFDRVVIAEGAMSRSDWTASSSRRRGVSTVPSPIRAATPTLLPVFAIVPSSQKPKDSSKGLTAPTSEQRVQAMPNFTEPKPRPTPTMPLRIQKPSPLAAGGAGVRAQEAPCLSGVPPVPRPNFLYALLPHASPRGAQAGWHPGPHDVRERVDGPVPSAAVGGADAFRPAGASGPASVADLEVVRKTAATQDGACRHGVVHAVGDQLAVDVHADHLAEHDPGVERRAVGPVELHHPLTRHSKDTGLSSTRGTFTSLDGTGPAREAEFAHFRATPALVTSCARPVAGHQVQTLPPAASALRTASL